MTEKPLLCATDFCLRHQSDYLVQGLSFDLIPGCTLGLVGESGSGKSLTSLAMMGLLPNTIRAGGSLRFGQTELLKLSEAQWTRRRGKSMAMIFQEPMSALNPSMSCGRQVSEGLALHTPLKSKARKKAVLELFEEVEIPEPKSAYYAYPHQLSGGQKQRVMIAMAIACRPQLLIADEPTTALDASVQAGILRLLKRLQTEYGMAMLFISHDLAVVRQVADSIMVLHHGQVQEYGTAEQIFNQPQHPYTKGLLACRPTPHTYYRRLPLVRDFLNQDFHSQEVTSPSLKDERAEQLTRQKALFEVKALSKLYSSSQGWWGRPRQVQALQALSLKVFPGESLGLVGESGSGKSTLGRILVGLEKAESGQILFEGKDLTRMSNSQWRHLHRSIQIIFQDPFASLNPRLPIGEAIAEVLRVQRGLAPKKARSEAESLLEKVGLLKDYYPRYPHEFSGGQRQRIGIARALATRPRFIVCDESVSALDVSVQAQILNLLKDLQEEFGFTYLFISHDFNVVRYFCDRIIVLKNGRLIEQGLAEELYRKPSQEYTRTLVKA